MLERERGGTRLEEQRPGEDDLLALSVHLELQVGSQGVCAREDVVRHSGTVANAEVFRRADLQRPDAAREQDSHARDRSGPELRSREVVKDDLRVADTLLRIAVGAVLTEPDAVSPAVTGDHERRAADGGRLLCRASVCRRTGDEQQNGNEYEGSTHSADPCEDANEASKGPAEQRLSLRNPHLAVCMTTSRANSSERWPCP